MAVTFRKHLDVPEAQGREVRAGDENLEINTWVMVKTERRGSHVEHGEGKKRWLRQNSGEHLSGRGIARRGPRISANLYVEEFGESG